MAEVPELSIEALRPADLPDYMVPAWLGCISWALGDEGAVAAFRQESGCQWRPAASPLEQMVDKATGADRAFLEAFIRWVNVNIWGPVDGPPESEEPT